MKKYNFNNDTEEAITDNELIDLAIVQLRKTYNAGKIKAAFCAGSGSNVYIITADGTIYKSETLSRNEGELDIFGQYTEDPIDFLRAIRLVEDAKSFGI